MRLVRFASWATHWSAATPDDIVSKSTFNLYIVRCADGTLYTGIATDVNKRLAEHESGPRGAKFLRGRGPLEIIFSEVVGDRSSASQMEYRVKRLNRAQKLALVEGHSKLADLEANQVVEEDCA